MSGTARQFALPLAELCERLTLPFMPAPSNQAALTWLERQEHWPEGRLLIWGEAGLGKTHLLQHWGCQRQVPPIRGTDLSFPLELSLLGCAVDNADTAAETTLLHVINAAAEARCPLLLTARAPSHRWNIRLPDLDSRLRATAQIELGAADDGLLRACLAAMLGARQIEVAEPVQAWLLRRLPRTPAAIQEAAARLDRLALANGGRATRELAAQVVHDMCATWQLGPS